MTAWINDYFAACNSGEPPPVAAYFEPDGVHYFPPGMYAGPFRGARTIGERWHAAVTNGGSYWTVDQVITDPATGRAVIEWTHFKRKAGVMLRGDEWYKFSERGLISEIRAYYASPQDPRSRSWRSAATTMRASATRSRPRPSTPPSPCDGGDGGDDHRDPPDPARRGAVEMTLSGGSSTPRTAARSARTPRSTCRRRSPRRSSART